LDVLKTKISTGIQAQKEDFCFSFPGYPCIEMNASISSFIIDQMFGSLHSQHSVSFLNVSAASEAVGDLFGSSGGTSAVTGIRVTSAKQTFDLLQQFGPKEIEAGCNVVLTASRMVGGKKLRIHLTFGGSGAWEEAITSGVSLLSKLAARCICFRIANLGMSDFAQEWRRLFPGVPRTNVVSSCSLDGEQLRNALARVAELEQELEETRRRLLIRENTLVNVLIGSHPAFLDLADYPRRHNGATDKENGAANRVVFHSSVKEDSAAAVALPSSSKKVPTMQRTLSLTSAAVGGAVRVAATKPTTPGPAPAPASAVKSKAATPGMTRKTSIATNASASAIPGKKKPLATPGPGKTRSRVF
jgi:hypothetical protein